MFEVDFLPVGQAGRHGDAIAMRFTRYDTGGNAHVIIDAGFEANGHDLVKHVRRYYDTTAIDVALLTHPDGDHIGGMGVVIRELDVEELWVHRLGERGGQGLPAADAVDDLIQVAEDNGTVVREPFAGTAASADRSSSSAPRSSTTTSSSRNSNSRPRSTRHRARLDLKLPVAWWRPPSRTFLPRCRSATREEQIRATTVRLSPC